MKRELLITTALICAGIGGAGAQSTNAPSAAATGNPPQTRPSNVPSQEQANEMMKVINEALAQKYPGYKVTAVAASPAPPVPAAVAAQGAAATGTVPAPNCTVIIQTPFGTLSLC